MAWVPRNCFLLSPDRFHPPVVVVAFERAWEKGEASFGPQNLSGGRGRKKRAWERGGKRRCGSFGEKIKVILLAVMLLETLRAC